MQNDPHVPVLGYEVTSPRRARWPHSTYGIAATALFVSTIVFSITGIATLSWPTYRNIEICLWVSGVPLTVIASLQRRRDPLFMRISAGMAVISFLVFSFLLPSI